MGSKWPTVQLRKVADLHTDKIDPRRVPDQEVRHFSLPAFDIDARPVVELGSAIASAKTTVPEDAVLLSKLNPHIPRIWVPRVEPGVLNLASTEFLVLQPLIGIDRHYLAYAVESSVFQESFRSAATGTSGSHQRVPASVAMSCQVPLPDPVTQRGIVAVLQGLDDKIELNRRMAETLDQIAQTLFRLWFVEPTGHAWPSGGEGLPEGWKVERLGEHVDAARGLSYSGGGLTDDAEGLPMHNLNSIRAGGGYKPAGLKRYQGEYKSRHAVRAGELIVANTDLTQNMEVIGSPALVPRCFGEEGLFSHHLYRVRPRARSPLTTTYLYWLLRDPRMHRVLAGFTNGTTVNMLPLDGLEMPKVLVPPAELVQQFTNAVAPMQELRECLESENDTLREIRDTLLPPLLDGRVEVPASTDEEAY